MWYVTHSPAILSSYWCNICTALPCTPIYDCYWLFCGVLYLLLSPFLLLSSALIHSSAASVIPTVSLMAGTHRSQALQPSISAHSSSSTPSIKADSTCRRQPGVVKNRYISNSLTRPISLYPSRSCSSRPSYTTRESTSSPGCRPPRPVC